MISITAVGLRNLASVLDALDKSHAETGLCFRGAVTMPAERYSVMAHEVDVAVSFSDAGKVHTIDTEG